MGAVGVGDFFGFDEEVPPVGGVGPEGGEVVGFEEVEHLEDGDALARRGDLVDVVAAVVGGDGV